MIVFFSPVETSLLNGTNSRVTDYEEHNQMTTDALAIVFSPNLLRAPHNDFLMIMSNMQHTNKLVKALVTHVRVLEFVPSTNRSFIDYSSTLSSTRRKQKRIKSTMTTNLMNPFPRRMKKLKQRTRATQRNEISHLFPSVTWFSALFAQNYFLTLHSSILFGLFHAH